mmetsp:Transcript_12382/g.37066  ORF Transcript_12382/g.37066 Transcript_12382/m.37066 type:complete len:258 (+) Transcript_12382:1230-2003(+)
MAAALPKSGVTLTTKPRAAAGASGPKSAKSARVWLSTTERETPRPSAHVSGLSTSDTGDRSSAGTPPPHPSRMGSPASLTRRTQRASSASSIVPAPPSAASSETRMRARATTSSDASAPSASRATASSPSTSCWVPTLVTSHADSAPSTPPSKGTTRVARCVGPAPTPANSTAEVLTMSTACHAAMPMTPAGSLATTSTWTVSPGRAGARGARRKMPRPGRAAALGRVAGAARDTSSTASSKVTFSAVATPALATVA